MPEASDRSAVPISKEFHGFLRNFKGILRISENATPEASDRFAVRFEIAIARDRHILRRQFLRNGIPEALSFPICYFLLNFDLRKASKQRFRIDTSNLRLQRTFCPFGFTAEAPVTQIARSFLREDKLIIEKARGLREFKLIPDP